jgi:hypothetical protein
MKNPKPKLGDLVLIKSGGYFLTGAAAGAGAAGAAAVVVGGTNGPGSAQGPGGGVPAVLYLVATELIAKHNL